MTPGASAGGALARRAFMTSRNPRRDGSISRWNSSVLWKCSATPTHAREDKERHHDLQRAGARAAGRDGVPREGQQGGCDETEGDRLFEVLVMVQEHQLRSRSSEAEKQDRRQKDAQSARRFARDQRRLPFSTSSAANPGRNATVHDPKFRR